MRKNETSVICLSQSGLSWVPRVEPATGVCSGSTGLLLKASFCSTSIRFKVGSFHTFSCLIFCLLRSLMNKMLAGTNLIWHIFMPVVRAHSKWAICNLFPGNIPPKHQQTAEDHLTSLSRKTLLTWTGLKTLGVYQAATLFCLPRSLLSGEKHNPLPPPIPLWCWNTCQTVPTTEVTWGPGLGNQGAPIPWLQIRPSVRHLTLTQAGNSNQKKKKILLWDLTDDKTK